MITNIWFYSVFPLCAAIFCLALLKKAYKANANTPYIKLFANLAILNILQCTGYILFAISPPIAEYIADAYLISLYFLFIHLLMVALSLSPHGSPAWGNYFYAFPLALTALHLMGLMVDSYRIEHNSLMHDDGRLGWCLDVFVLFSSVLSAFVFIRNNKKIQNNNVMASRNIIAIYSFFPLIGALVGLSALSKTSYALPVVIVVPAISIYIMATFYYISRSQIIDLTIGWKGIRQRLYLLEQGLGQLNNKRDFDHLSYKWREQLYKEAMERNNNDYKAASEDISVSESTLRKFFKTANE